jgi:hypothetical protein
MAERTEGQKGVSAMSSYGKRAEHNKTIFLSFFHFLILICIHTDKEFGSPWYLHC